MSDSVIDAIADSILYVLMSWPVLWMSGLLTICVAMDMLIQLPR